MTDVTAGAGVASSFAVTSSGQLFSFGDNRYGQLGNTNNSGVFEAANPTPSLSDLPGGTTIGSIGGGPSSYDTLAVVSGLAVTTSTLPAGQLGVPYGATAGASGGEAPYRWAAGGLPAGLGIDSATGQITGTPTATPTSAADAEGTTASATLPLTIPPASVASATNPAVSAPAVHTCRVPKLKGEKLKAAKKRIKAADCKLGKVTKKGAAGRKPEVVKQEPVVGTTRPAGSKINVVLGGR